MPQTKHTHRTYIPQAGLVKNLPGGTDRVVRFHFGIKGGGERRLIKTYHVDVQKTQ